MFFQNPGGSQFAAIYSSLGVLFTLHIGQLVCPTLASHRGGWREGAAPPPDKATISKRHMRRISHKPEKQRQTPKAKTTTQQTKKQQKQQKQIRSIYKNNIHPLCCTCLSLGALDLSQSSLCWPAHVLLSRLLAHVDIVFALDICAIVSRCLPFPLCFAGACWPISAKCREKRCSLVSCLHRSLKRRVLVSETLSFSAEAVSLGFNSPWCLAVSRDLSAVVKLLAASLARI